MWPVYFDQQPPGIIIEKRYQKFFFAVYFTLNTRYQLPVTTMRHSQREAPNAHSDALSSTPHLNMPTIWPCSREQIRVFCRYLFRVFAINNCRKFELSTISHLFSATVRVTSFLACILWVMQIIPFSISTPYSVLRINPNTKCSKGDLPW